MMLARFVSKDVRNTLLWVCAERCEKQFTVGLC